MGTFAFTKSMIARYYPRNHLAIASVLGLTLTTILLLTPDEPAHGDRVQAIQPIDPQAIHDVISANAEFLHQAAVSGAIQDPLMTADPVKSAWTRLEVQAGDNLSDLFRKVGLTDQDLYKVLNSNDEAKVLNRLYPGYQLAFHIPEAGRLAQLEVLKSPIDGYLFTLNENNFDVEPIQHVPDIKAVFKTGSIDDSLFMAGQRADIPAVTIMEMADIFGGVIDFMMDPRQGDQFSILYEEKYLNGEFIGNGAIIGAQFINEGKEYLAVRYEAESGDTGYFNPEGESMRKAFLRNPLDVVRISSNFNLKRKHPILNTIRAHKGTDYAAPKGTPVRATSDGVVTWAARNGSFGKLIVIEHSGQFETKYAHLNDYASGIKKGSRVKQGQVIGFVGTTGGSTGPHLHYEFLVAGVHKDWRTIIDKLPKAISIEAEEMQRFREHTAPLLAQFRTHVEDNRMLTSTGVEQKH